MGALSLGFEKESRKDGRELIGIWLKGGWLDLISTVRASGCLFHGLSLSFYVHVSALAHQERRLLKIRMKMEWV